MVFRSPVSFFLLLLHYHFLTKYVVLFTVAGTRRITRILHEAVIVNLYLPFKHIYLIMSLFISSSEDEDDKPLLTSPVFLPTRIVYMKEDLILTTFMPASANACSRVKKRDII